MRVSKWMMLAGCCGIGMAAEGVLMNGSVVMSGATFSYETRLEPATPTLAGGFVGGNVTDAKGIHRYLAYNAQKKFFGYDLQVMPGGEVGTFRVAINALSITPARIELKDPESWMVIPMPAYPSPQTVRWGDTVAIEMFNNPTTGQKITDYIHFPRSDRFAVAHVIAPGEQIFVNVLHQPEATGSLTVREDGTIAMRFAGEVKAAGLTPEQVSDAIAERLKGKFGHAVEVNVQIVKVRKVFVSGDVRRPGTYPLEGPMTVLEAIVRAGGPGDFAKKKAIYVLRGKEKFPFNMTDVSRGKGMEQNIVLKDGDVVVVP
jgi:polysaccharide export outer membrane protein